MTEGHSRMALHEALENVAREVDILARKAHQIDEAMGDAICAGDTADALPLALTQDVDLMRQSADCLHILLNNLAEIAAGSNDARVQVEAEDVTQGVYLTAIRTRVGGAPAPAPVAPAGQDWIDL